MLKQTLDAFFVSEQLWCWKNALIVDINPNQAVLFGCSKSRGGWVESRRATFWHSIWLFSTQNLHTYRRAQWKRTFCPFMKQNADFQESISPAYSIAAPLPTPKFLTTNESFHMGYYMRIFLKGHQNGQRTNFYSYYFTE